MLSMYVFGGSVTCESAEIMSDFIALLRSWVFRERRAAPEGAL